MKALEHKMVNPQSIQNPVHCRGYLLKLLSLILAFSMHSYAAPSDAEEKKSLLEIVLEIAGISATPSGLKGPGDDIQSGELTVVTAAGGNPYLITDGNGFRSPIFVHGEDSVLALKGEQVVRIKVSGSSEKAVVLFSVPGIIKLVGTKKDNGEQILVLLDNNRVGLLSLATAKVSPIIYGPSSPERIRMLNHLRGWNRQYGEIRLYTKRQTEDGIAGPVEWTDVYLKNGSDAPVNISRCAGTNCTQPSLSSDGRLIVFVKVSIE